MNWALPHSYPFRFVDSILEDRPQAAGRAGEKWQGRVKSAISANGRATRDGAWGFPMLYVEAIAQAALLLEGGDPEIGRQGFLAGIDGFQTLRAPEAGETLDISVRLAARFGGIVKFEGEVRSGDELLARGTVLVKKGEGVGRGT
jgi:3-hydroxymyristoyl/3-hydroxydecanoyl-(acyl carrier protein) dehydratase